MLYHVSVASYQSFRVEDRYIKYITFHVYVRQNLIEYHIIKHFLVFIVGANYHEIHPLIYSKSES